MSEYLEVEKLGKQFFDLKLGEHLCSIYKNQEEQFRLVLPFMFSGLGKKEKCIYITDENTKSQIIAAFTNADQDVAEYLKSGQLEFFTKEEAYLKDGYFDPERMIEMLKLEQEQALKDGYAGLRVTGEMTWVFAKLPGVEKLMEYEMKLNYFFPESKSAALCQYNENRFSPEVMFDVIRAHPKVAVEEK